MWKLYNFTPLRPDTDVNKSLPRLREHDIKYSSLKQEYKLQQYYVNIYNSLHAPHFHPWGRCSLAALPRGQWGVESSAFELTLRMRGVHDKSELWWWRRRWWWCWQRRRRRTATADDDDDDDDEGITHCHLSIMQLYYNVKNDLFFKFCVVFMFMMMMMLTTMMMLLKMCGRIPRHHGIGFTSQFHNTVKPIPRCMWNWFAKNNSTTPWNQFHGAVEFNCNTKAALPR